MTLAPLAKDKYDIIYNPNNLIFKYEAWVCGEEYEHFKFRPPVINKIVKCFKVCRTKEKAQQAIEYYQALTEFKEAV